MRHNLSKTIVLMLVLVLSASCLFAAAVSESAPEAKFQSLDLEKASLKEIMQSFDDAIISYEAKYEHLTEQMTKFYREGDADNYFDAKSMRRDLAYPTVTAEQAKVLYSRLAKETNEELKGQFAQWLYKNSKYYRPSITLKVEMGNSVYRYTISVEPGQMVTLPKLQYRSRTLTFLGWGLDDQTVVYAEGEKIEMPYEELVLYGVFQSKEQEQKTEEIDGTPVVTVTPPAE